MYVWCELTLKCRPGREKEFVEDSDLSSSDSAV
jgi:hypothetical protein